MTAAPQFAGEACAQIPGPERLWWRVGGTTLMTATGALATASLVLTTPAPLPPWFNHAVGGLILAAAAAALVMRNIRLLWIACAIFWACLGMGDLTELVRFPIVLAAFIPLATVATLVVAAVRWCRPPLRSVGIALDVAAGATLVLFGAVHILNAADVTAIVPPWVPWPQAVPYLTGPIMITAGAAAAVPAIRAKATGIIAAMFVAWLPLVHVPRLLASPAAWAEWRFALSALALAGVLILTQSRGEREAL